MRWTPSGGRARHAGQYRELMHMVENDLVAALMQGGPLREPSPRRLSRRVKSFPFAPRVTLQPDEKAQHWLLSISATDRAGLLYTVARILAQHHLSVQLAKSVRWASAWKDSFSDRGRRTAEQPRQLLIETELLQALAV